MAAVSPAEFRRMLDLLSAEIGFERLKDRLARLGAFTSRRGLGSVEALSSRLYTLSGGLRREGTVSYGFHSLWSEVFLSRLGEEDEKVLGEIADRINACLEADQSVKPEQEATLGEQLASYHRTLANVVGDEVARLDMLLKTVPPVAARIRAWPGNTPAVASVAAEASPPAQQSEE